MALTNNNLLALSALDKHMGQVPCGPLNKALEPELTTAAHAGLRPSLRNRLIAGKLTSKSLRQ